MSTTRTRGGGLGPPPHRGRRGRAPVLALALATVGALAAAVVFLGLRAPAAPSGAPPLPFTLDAPGISAEEPTVLLYVSSSCPWCAAELRAWGELVGHGETLRPLVIASPTSDLSAPPLQAAARVLRVVHDSDGAIARQLGVTAVPVVAALLPGRRVVSLEVGLRSPERRQALLASLDAPDSLPEDPNP